MDGPNSFYPGPVRVRLIPEKDATPYFLNINRYKI